MILHLCQALIVNVEHNEDFNERIFKLSMLTLLHHEIYLYQPPFWFRLQKLLVTSFLFCTAIALKLNQLTQFKSLNLKLKIYKLKLLTGHDMTTSIHV